MSCFANSVAKKNTDTKVCLHVCSLYHKKFKKYNFSFAFPFFYLVSVSLNDFYKCKKSAAINLIELGKSIFCEKGFFLAWSQHCDVWKILEAECDLGILQIEPSLCGKTTFSSAALLFFKARGDFGRGTRGTKKTNGKSQRRNVPRDRNVRRKEKENCWVWWKKKCGRAEIHRASQCSFCHSLLRLQETRHDFCVF